MCDNDSCLNITIYQQLSTNNKYSANKHSKQDESRENKYESRDMLQSSILESRMLKVDANYWNLVVAVFKMSHSFVFGILQNVENICFYSWKNIILFELLDRLREEDHRKLLCVLSKSCPSVSPTFSISIQNNF